MSLGRGYSIPPAKDKGVILNGDSCIPVTPGKPILYRSNHSSESQMGNANWQDLVGIYSGLLQGDACNRARNFTPTRLISQSHRDPSNLEVAQIQRLRSFNQNAGNVGSSVQNSGNDVLVQRVNSLAELLGTTNAVRTPPANVAANRSYAVNRMIYGPHSQVLSNRTGYNYAHSTFQQNQPVHVNKNTAGYSLQNVPTGAYSVPYRAKYNMNLPPRIGAGESTSTVRLVQLEPATPCQQKQSKNCQPAGAPHILVDEMPPRIGTSASTGTVRIVQLEAATTGQQKQSKNSQPAGAQHIMTDEIPNQEKDNQENVVSSQQPEIVEKQPNQFMQNIQGTPSAANPGFPKQNDVSDDGNHKGIDLNQTPQQKTPKRRKHRPKVVVEGKPKRTPKPAAPKTNSPEGNPSGKRKYVRRKDTKASKTQVTDLANEVGVSDVSSAAKSCRRVLNFDLENGVEKKSQDGAFGNLSGINEKRNVHFPSNLHSHNAEGIAGFNRESTPLSVKGGHQNVQTLEKQQAANLPSFVHSANQIWPQVSLPLASTAPLSTAKDHSLNVIARSFSMRNVNTNQRSSQSWYSQANYHDNGGQLAQLAVQEHTRDAKQDGRRQPMLQTGTQYLEDLVCATDRRGSKREYCHTELTQPQTSALMCSQLLRHGVSKNGYHTGESSKACQEFSETIKRRKVMDALHGTSSSTPYSITTVEDFSRQVEGRGTNSVHANNSTLHMNGGFVNSDLEGNSTARKPNNDHNGVTQEWFMNLKDIQHEFQQQHSSSQVHSRAEQMAQKESYHMNKAQSANALAAVTILNLESSSQRGAKSIHGNEFINSPAHVSVNGQTDRPTSSNQAFSIAVVSEESKKARGYSLSSKKVSGLQEDFKHAVAVGKITDRLKALNLNNGKEIVQEEQTALVPYKPDGVIVLHENFDPIKKRPPRPKVNLDPETNRIWNLLMGAEGSQSTETMDKDREKWWEEERKVFRGRVDSFIARMHLVQGDRRFSKWKGSVVDSVIGVFLTQNVSDHLSSSAFMSLAARFPLQPTNIRQTSCQHGGSPSVEKHEVQITHPDGTITYDHGIIRQPVYNHSSATSSGSCHYGPENVGTKTRTVSTDGHIRRTEEDVISSQNSSESFIFQANDDIRSSSGSNSEAEDQITGCNLTKNTGPLNLFVQAERCAAFHEHQCQVMGSAFHNEKLWLENQQSETPIYNMQKQVEDGGSKTYANPIISNVPYQRETVSTSTSSGFSMTTELEEWEANFVASPGKESTLSLASTDFENSKTTPVEHAHDTIGQSLERRFVSQQNRTPEILATRMDQAIPNKHFEPQSKIPAESQGNNSQHSANSNRGRDETVQQESNLTDCTGPAEGFSEKPSDNLPHSKNKITEPNEVDHGNPSGKPSNPIGSTTSNARKQKVDMKKTEANWDDLRKQVYMKVGKRERTKETLDSLDYEALRKADVREISATIKERGMNNMLAERIKDFLDRLIQDHEGIDLEWLRDVPPEKSKDYLLSIRGLGLKSVECVRLLTLHNLAFPVDTNVGRIAVRLGWVPLQPLPEELQLHLLELYPMLETIQKYLWPRLCKLDQKTLYELHYQMITFGKVFCTKKQPNCNACPMRGECRHFASAFTSARLALPGPEEKRMVPSTAPPTANANPEPMIKPMALPQLDETIDRETRASMQNCEPIIEEPTTPEPPLEVSQSDIEDAFYEDPEEFPEIKLNIEEFATNLQSFMQKNNKEMQESDLSKALVALSPQKASIPMPKLKSVSRLRTEHQVYELPDAHPLLNGLERREADDPSPYLLAIWTPGETADSVQPPESKCSDQESGGLCDKKMCFSCNSKREEQAQTVRGTILIPCRTAMRGSFPLNGTYFQVNEVFADHKSSIKPIDVPRNYLWNLPRRTVFFGTSVSTIFKGLTTEGIQYCFWKGFVCVRGFEQDSRAPRPLVARLHFYPASKTAKQNKQR